MKTGILVMLLFVLGGTTTFARTTARGGGGNDSMTVWKPTVELVYFTSSPGNTGAFLQWRVNDAASLQYFVVERAFDGKHFKPLAIVNGKNEQLVYFYKDAQVQGNFKKAYYRVKIVEPGGAAPSHVSALKPIR